MYKPMPARESLTRPLVCAAVLTAVFSSGGAADERVIYKTRWQFNTKRGAILLMYRPRLIRVPDGFFAEKFNPAILKRKVVVEQVYNCPGFYMYLSNKGGHCPILRSLHCSVPDDGQMLTCTYLPLASEQVSVTLGKGTFPVTGASTEQVLTVGWSTDGSIGVYQHAFREDAVYTPLIRLKPLGRRLWR